MNRARFVLALLLMLLLLPATMAAAQDEPGIRGQTAPSWTVDNWFNLEDGAEEIDISDFRGKGSISFSFSTDVRPATSTAFQR